MGDSGSGYTSFPLPVEDDHPYRETKEHPYREAQKMLETSHRRSYAKKMGIAILGGLIFSGGMLGGMSYSSRHPKTVVKEVQVVKEIPVIKEVLAPSICVDTMKTERWVVGKTETCDHPAQKMEVSNGFGSADKPSISIHTITCTCVR